MPITAAYDLETAQLDSVNAFLNSDMDETVYCEFPKSYEQSEGKCLLLKKVIGTTPFSNVMAKRIINNII